MATTPGHLFVISAPSGTGKTTVVHELQRRLPQLADSVSCTTRAPRPNERDGVDYHFISHQQFQEMIAAQAFVEWAPVYDNFYGTPKKPLETWRAAGRDVILDLDIQGAAAVKQYDPSATLIFLAPPSLEILAARLRGRGTEDPATLERRLQRAAEEMAARDRYDHVIVNDDIQTTCDALLRILQPRV